MKRSRFWSFLLCIVLIFSLTPSASAAQTITVDPINVMVGGKIFLPTDVNGKDVPIFVYQGTTYAPLRALAEAYGLTVGYNAVKKLATVDGTPSGTFAGSKGRGQALTKTTALSVSSISIEVNGQVFRPRDANGKAVSVFVYNGTTYAPLRALAEAYGLTVSYDNSKKLAAVDFVAGGKKDPVYTPPAGAEVVSSAIQVENTINAPKNAVPELAAWSNHTASSDRVITKSEKNVNYTVPTGLETIEEYIEMLQENGFTMVDEYYFSYKNKTFRSWAFTCDASPDAETIKMQYENTPCHVCIWMSEDDDEYRIGISPSLQFFDTGVRRNGGVNNEVIAGPSAGAALLRVGAGRYQTADGRLSASLGTAMVIRDGKTYTCDARWVVEGEDERLWVENYYRNEGFFMEVPKNSLMEGDVLQMTNFLRERYYVTEKEKLTAYNWHTPFFAIAYDGQWMGPVLNGKDFKALTVRLMYYEPGGEAVYYVYAELKDKEPSVVEALVAVDLSVGSAGSFGNATRMSVGDTFTLNYSNEVYGSDYHVYNWAVTDGVGNVRIDGTGSKCRVQAVGKGIATVTVTYSYTEEGPDVLTGIIRTQRRSRSQSYNFIIE